MTSVLFKMEAVKSCNLLTPSDRIPIEAEHRLDVCKSPHKWFAGAAKSFREHSRNRNKETNESGASTPSVKRFAYSTRKHSNNAVVKTDVAKIDSLEVNIADFSHRRLSRIFQRTLTEPFREASITISVDDVSSQDEIGNSNTTTQKSVGPRLFRKQRSTTGEDEVSKTEEPQEPEEVDPIYLMLKQATIMRQGKAAAGTDEGGLQMNISKTQAASAEELARQQQQLAEQISKIAIANNPLLQLKQLEVAPPFVNKSSGTPRLASSTRSLLVNTPSVESQCSDKSDTSSKVSVTNGSVVTNGNKILVPILKHPKLTGKMKSLSLDSSDHSGIIQNLQPLPFPSCFPRSTLSPACIEQRRHTSLQWSKNSSVETADEMERSSCSTSCTSNGPSPYGSSLNNSLPPLPIVISSGAWYALLANYPARHPEEPDLRAGEKFLIGDHPHDSEWLQGVTEDGVVCTIPAAYLARLSPGERPVRVLENLQLFEGRKSLKLLRNQIVITFQEDADGGLWIRTMDGYRAKCPAEYLQYTD